MIALGYASSLSEGEERDLTEKLTDATHRVRATSRMVTEWLDGA